MEHTKRSIDPFILFTGVFFISITTLPFVLQSVLFMVNSTTGSWLFPAVVLGSMAVCVKQLSREFNAKAITVWVGMITVLLVGLYKLCVTLYDFSYDGMWYQQDGVRLIAQGWNPFKHYLLLEETALSDLYVNHYPKASWITGGSIYAFTHQLESGKMMNGYAMFASACFCYLALRAVFSLNKFVTIVLTVFFVLNPVVIYQLFTFYVDGLMGSMLLCLLCMAALFYTQKVSPLWLVYVVGVCIVFGVNIKFTALVYTCVFVAAFVAFAFVYHRNTWIKICLVLGVLVTAGAGIWGYPTYVRNTVGYSHPFYPLMGKGNIGEEVAKVTMPANFFGKNRFEQFNLATFAKAKWSRAPYESHPKALFTTDSFTILDEYKRADPDMSGFGPLFAEILLLVAAGLVLVIVLNRKQFTRYGIWTILTLIVSIVIIPAFWYARYVPQLWTLIILFSILIFEQRKVRILACFIWVLVLVNCVLVAQQNTLWRIKQTHTLNALFDKFKQSKQRPVIYEGWVSSFKIKLQEQAVPYTPTLKGYAADSITIIPNVEMSGAFYVNSSVK